MRVKNISGGPVHFPAAGKDVDDGEVVDVPDDTVLPEAYFAEADDQPAKPADKPAAPAVADQPAAQSKE